MCQLCAWWNSCQHLYKNTQWLNVRDSHYTAKNAPVATSLLTSCNNLADINKPISRCVRMACDSLLTTSLLQVVNKLVASWFSKLVIHRLNASCFTSCNKSADDKLQQAWFWQACCNLMKLKSLLQLVNNLQQAGKIDNLQQVWQFLFLS